MNKADMRRLRAKGWTLQRIASKYGVSRQYVHSLTRDVIDETAHGKLMDLWGRRFFGAVALAARRESKKAHGTRTSYIRGCHCDLCREAQRDYMRSFRERSKSRL